MFEHSVRVPRHFKIAANIVQKVTEEGGSVKTLLYDNKLKHFRTSVLYALINESIKHAADIENMFENTGILVNEPRLDPWLAKVLTAELVYGKKSLPGKSKPEQTILSYKERFAKFTPDVQDDQKSKVVRRPRYVRINTNLLTTSDAIRAFQDEGYKFIRCTSGSYNDYLQQVQNLTEYDFTQDYHVKTIFVFPPGTKLHEHDLYLENKIILQDKATALAVHLLAAPPGSVVLDMCAAPGMKTTQLAAYMRNQGKIYAVERNEKRYETLCQYVEATASKCVETLHKDSLEIRRGDLDDVEYILLDPSCSGSGMELSVHNYIDETRLAKLTSLQEKFLKHAMNSFPNAKRIVYSTCSIFPEENERVVTNIVKASRAKWRVKDVKELLKDQWNNFGSGMYGSMGTRCLYAKPDTDFTIGFFLAVLDKDLRESEKPDEIIVEDSNNKTNQDSKTNKTLNEDANDVKSEQNETRNKSVEENEQLTKKKKKKKHDELQSIKSKAHPDNSELSEECNTANMLQLKTTKKKRNSEIIEKSEEKHKISDSDNKKLKNNVDAGKKIEKFESTERSKSIASQKSSDDILSDSTKKKDKSLEILEASENISIEYSENQMSNKKKKKRRDSKSLEAETETVKENYKITPESDMLIENEAMTKKMKKKRKDLQNESLEAVTETIIDIPSNIEQEKTSKKRKKRKNQKDSLLSPETENERLNNSFDFQTLNSEQLLGETHDDYNAEKVKKRKQKSHKEEIEDGITDSIVIDNNSFKTEKETKKKKKKRELVNSNLSCELMQESDTMETKHRDEMKEKKTDVKQHFITEVNQSSEVPKKKKKKRDSETS